MKDLHDAVGGTADVVIRKGDARFDDLVPKDKIGTVSGILTSPPVPGVYDYVSFARKQRSRFRVGSTAGNGRAITTTSEETESLKPPTSYYVDAKSPTRTNWTKTATARRGATISAPPASRRQARVTRRPVRVQRQMDPIPNAMA